MVLKCTKKNFPYKSFYNEIDNMIHSFYRQGQAFNINASDANDVKFEQMTDLDLGQMFMVNSRALIARSSSQILFFKQMIDEEDETIKEWKQYNVVNRRGFIFFIKGGLVKQEISTYYNLRN